MINKTNSQTKSNAVILLMCCGLAAAAIGISINSSGVFYTPVSEALSISRGAFSMHMTIFSFATAFIALAVPALMKRISYRVILWISIILAVLSTAMMGIVHQVIGFYVLGAIRGVSTGLFSIVPLTIIINHFIHKRRGFATSLVFGFSGLAGAIFSPILTHVIEGYGWQAGYVCKALILMLLCMPALLCSSRLSSLQVTNKQRKDVKEQNRYHYASLGFVCFFVFALINTSISSFTQHLPGFSASIGYGLGAGAALLSAGMVGNIVSKLIIGIIADAFDCVKATLIMIVANVIGILMLLQAGSQTILMIGAFLFGSIYSIGAVALPLLTTHFFGEEHYAQVFPAISFASNAGSAAAFSIIGFLYDQSGSYTTAFVLCLVIHAAGILLLAVVAGATHKQVSVQANKIHTS